MEEQGPPQGQPSGQPQPGDLMATITSAFNLGVAMRQHGGGKSVVDVVEEMRETIFSNLSKTHGSQFEQDYIVANTEYLLQIALLGFIIPSICAYDEEFKNRLFALIAAKLDQSKSQQPKEQDKNIIIT